MLWVLGVSALVFGWLCLICASGFVLVAGCFNLLITFVDARYACLRLCCYAVLFNTIKLRGVVTC